MTLAALFTESMQLSDVGHAWLLVPLCLAVSVVYKTIRCRRLANVPLSAVVLCLTIVAGMYAVGVGMWLLHFLFA